MIRWVMRPVIYSNSCVVLPPRLCGSVEYYAYAWRYADYVQDWSRKFDKRDKDTHRFTIADTRGQLSLTVPISKPSSSSCRWSDIEISTHGAWWDVHRVALESAYGRTPFFEFYVDRFLPMLTVGVEDRYPRLEELASAWDAEIRSILGLPKQGRGDGMSPEVHSEDLVKVDAAEMSALRVKVETTPYYQVRADKLGFIPHLSILDLIFNLGPESQLYLQSL